MRIDETVRGLLDTYGWNSTKPARYIWHEQLIVGHKTDGNLFRKQDTNKFSHALWGCTIPKELELYPEEEEPQGFVIVEIGKKRWQKIKQPWECNYLALLEPGYLEVKVSFEDKLGFHKAISAIRADQNETRGLTISADEPEFKIEGVPTEQMHAYAAYLAKFVIHGGFR